MAHRDDLDLEAELELELEEELEDHLDNMDYDPTDETIFDEVDDDDDTPPSNFDSHDSEW